MNWDDLRFFLAVARSASLTEAGRRLGVSQPTVSRRLAAMEARLGTSLFEKGPRGHALSAAGSDILETAEHVEEEITGIGRRVYGHDGRLSGSIRITCTDVMANHYLVDRLARFAAAHPEIELSLNCSLQHLSLTRREADVAVRVTSQPPETLVGRRLARVAIGVYAAPAYLKEAGRPAEACDWIGWQDEAYNRMIIAAHFPGTAIRHRADDMLAIVAMARAGLGLVILPCYVGDPDPQLTRVVAEPVDEGIMDLWVLSHPDLRRAARVRAVTAFIAECVSADRALFEGRRQG
ncbi:MAG: LysR family transcriptional regulator [Paracoccaceae bacterium]